ncbi:MAG: RecQ family ATP-dependent DNA helicase [Rikenellaceae bacterium]
MEQNLEKYLEILKKWWGYDSFRPSQFEAIESLASGRDTLVLMPTGGGKSLLYQVPALAREGVCIVVTPLISLMKDQVDRLKKLGINAVAIHSGMTSRQIDYAFDNCVYGDVKFLYIAPERIAGELFRLRVMRMTVSYVAVDEAHCISQWGYDFRPSYLKIAQIRKFAPQATFIALTASATDEVAKDIQFHLGFKDAKVVRSSFARANLSYVVRHSEDKLSQMLRIINNVEGCGIVYVRTREETENFARMLNENNISADYYNGGMNFKLRTEKQDSWTTGRIRVMVATNAFGMGIDKADVRFVIHYQMPDSLEAYYQETGRAGRDLNRSYAVLLHSDDEQSKAQKRFLNAYPPIETIKTCYEALFNFLQLGIGEGKLASYEFNIFEFSQRTKIFGPTALNAIAILQQNGYLTLTDASERPARLMFMVARDELYKIRMSDNEIDDILRVILRLYEGTFHNFVPIDIKEIAANSRFTPKQVLDMLKQLWTYRIIRYIPSSICSLLILNEERLPVQDVVISPESYKIRKDMALLRLNSAYDYAQNTKQCRSQILQKYFGEHEPDVCGVCDVCMERKRLENNVDLISPLIDEVLGHIRNQNLTLRELGEKVKRDTEIIAKVVDRLLEKSLIRVNEFGVIEYKGEKD